MQVNFDATSVTPQSFDPLPGGWYNAVLVEGLETPTKNNAETGNTYYAAVFEVIDGQYKGRKLFHNFNFKNTNEKAVQIAYEQLATICHAVGILKLNVMDQLFGKPMQVKVKLKAAVMEDDGVTEKYEAGNEIKGFKAIEGSGAGAASAAIAGGGLPAGFGDDEPAVTEAAEAAPAASAPAAKAPASPAAAPKQTKLVPTAKNEHKLTPQQFRDHDSAWTDELLVSEGYFTLEEVTPPAPKTPGAPTSPKAPAATATEAAGSTQSQTSAPASADEDDDTPPWDKE